MIDRGFTLVEALVATLLTLGVLGAALSFVAPDSYIAQSRPEAIDMQQRARVGADLISRDLFMAGAGPPAGAQSGPLVKYLPPVWPGGWGASPPIRTRQRGPIASPSSTARSGRANDHTFAASVRRRLARRRPATQLPNRSRSMRPRKGHEHGRIRRCRELRLLQSDRRSRAACRRAAPGVVSEPGYREGVSIAQVEMHTYTRSRRAPVAPLRR